MEQSPELWNIEAKREALIAQSNKVSAMALQNNQIVVSPGGATFTSIQTAINSITDASEQKQYSLYIGPGTYNENVVMKPWVGLFGAGQDENGQNYTIISAPGSNSETAATVIAASNSNISAVTVESTYAPGMLSCACIDCTGATDFSCYGVIAIATDSPNEACNLFGIVNNRGNGTPTVTSSVELYDCTLTAQAQNPQSFAIALWAVSGGTYMVADCILTGVSNYVAVGGCGNPGAGSVLKFSQCSITGTQYCLQTADGSTVMAMQCKLTGPVGPGVIVKD